MHCQLDIAAWSWAECRCFKTGNIVFGYIQEREIKRVVLVHCIAKSTSNMMLDNTRCHWIECKVGSFNRVFTV